MTSDIEELLEQLRRGVGPGSPARRNYVLRQGSLWWPASRPNGLDAGAGFQCWEQVEHVVTTRPDLDLAYVEGFAWGPQRPDPDCHEHAWLGTAEGGAVDVHWSDIAGWIYFGVKVERATFDRILRSRRQRQTVLDVLVGEEIGAA